mmetsp:Transcript_2418/g.9365  ORF Transcript_2418/g.9365 Transcript_2418/m.9365 type:complete len:225 (+) Transcript_2418:998-1672(+)
MQAAAPLIDLLPEIRGVSKHRLVERCPAERVGAVPGEQVPPDRLPVHDDAAPGQRHRVRHDALHDRIDEILGDVDLVLSLAPPLYVLAGVANPAHHVSELRDRLFAAGERAEVFLPVEGAYVLQLRDVIFAGARRELVGDGVRYFVHAELVAPPFHPRRGRDLEVQDYPRDGRQDGRARDLVGDENREFHAERLFKQLGVRARSARVPEDEEQNFHEPLHAHGR